MKSDCMHYQKHVFMCTNQKVPGKQCCANHGAQEAVQYLKEQLLERGLHGPGKIRVSQSGCLGRCSQGPCVVIYPEGVWYRYDSLSDLDEIIEQHILRDKTVEHLLMDIG